MADKARGKLHAHTVEEKNSSTLQRATGHYFSTLQIDLPVPPLDIYSTETLASVPNDT